jgi:hypothetical protein
MLRPTAPRTPRAFKRVEKRELEEHPRRSTGPAWIKDLRQTLHMNLGLGRMSRWSIMKGTTLPAAGAVAVAIVSLAGALPALAATEPATKPVRMASTPAYALHRCTRSVLLRPACPRRLPYVGREPAWDAFLCSHGKPGCLGLTWDDFELEHVDFGPTKPPTWAHIAIFAGDLSHAFPFSYPTQGTPTRLRSGLFSSPRTRAVFLGHVSWGGKDGTLVLAPAFPDGGEQGDHFIFRWQRGGVSYAVGLHGWEPAPQAVATLKAIIESLP